MKIFISILLFLVIVQSSFSQNWNDVYYIESEAEYLLSYNQIDDAIDLYKEALKMIPNSANLKFKLAYAFLISDDKQIEAIKYLEEAVEDISKEYNPMAIKEVTAPVESMLLLGNAYRINNQIDKAIESYNKYKGLLEADDVENKKVAEQYIKSCKNIQMAINKPIKVNITNLGETFNTAESNKHIVISGNGKRMAYNTYTSEGIDVYIVDKEPNGNWGPPRKKTTQIGKFMRVSSISQDGNTLYVIFDDPSNYDIYVSYFEKKKWTKAAKLKKPINTKYNETHASISNDGTTLYFTSDRKDGLGGIDIYKSTVDSKGKWSEPSNLGNTINTEFDEETPFISNDNSLLFFSSIGHEGYGGFDIFYANSDGSGKAKNLGFPINNTRDNLFFYPESGTRSGYIAYYNEKGKGKKDLYHVNIIPNITLNGSIAGDLIAENTQPYDISIKNSLTDELVASISVNANEKNFKYELPTGNYTVSVSNNLYTPFSETISIPEDYTSENINFTAKLEKIEIAEEIVEDEITEEVDTEPVLAMNNATTEVIPLTEVTTTKKEVKEPKEEEKIEEVKLEVKKEAVPTVEEIRKKEPVKEQVETQKAPVIEVQQTKEETKLPIEIVHKSSGVSYSVQIAALTQPVDNDYFKNINNITITKGKDNFFRYTIGYTESEAEAKSLLAEIQSKGFPKAFIKKNNFTPNYTIQFMSLKESLDYRHFDSVYGYSITKTEGGWFRYTYGMYDDYEQAKEKLPEIASLGYNGAFVKKVK